MDIFDLAKATGLSCEHIRFYEEKGIIANRLWSIRREFDRYDVSRLKKAVVLRKMGFDLSVVPLILDDSVPLKETLLEQFAVLEAEKEKFDGAYNLCVAMLERIRASKEKVKMEYLDADEWYEFACREEAVGHTFVDCWQDIESHIYWNVLEPFFVKDLRKNKRRNMIANVIGGIALYVLALLLNLIVTGSWDWIWEFPCFIVMVALCSLPRYLLGKKHPRAAIWLPSGLLIGFLLLVFAILIIFAN